MTRPSWIPTRDYLCNHIINRIPFHDLRMRLYRAAGVRIGSQSTILMLTHLNHAGQMKMGSHTIINGHCYLDGRGGLSIGDNVNISSHVLLVAGSHDIQRGDDFTGFVAPITIEDHVWLCSRCTILPGVTVHRGAVVAAGAVVTHDVPPYTIVAGVPARKMGDRNPNLAYTLSYPLSWE